MQNCVGVGGEQHLVGQDVVRPKQDTVDCIGCGVNSGSGGSSSASHSSNISQVSHMQMQELLIQDEAHIEYTLRTYS